MDSPPRIEVGARELKTRLGSWLRRVRAGQIVIVTDRGRAVAELRPLAPDSDSLEARLASMEARGLLTRAVPGAFSTGPLAEIRGAPVSTTLADDREDRF